VNEWVKTTVGEFCPFVYGKALKESNRSNSGEFLVVGSGGPSGSHNVALSAGPTTVIGRKGSVGTTYFAPGGCWPIDTTFFVADVEERDPRYTFYLLSSLGLSAMNSDSAVPGLNRDAAHAVAVCVPPLQAQRAIASVLGALDDKIESNLRISENLRQLIKIEWDVAKDESWPANSLSSLATFVNGGAFTKGATGSGRMVIRIAELNSGPGSSTIYNELDVHDDKVARPGDILMSWSGSLGVYIWVRNEAIINQHIFKVIPDEYPAWLVFNCLNEALPVFRQTASDKATTMGHIQRHHLDDAQVQVPSSDSLESLDLVMSPMWQRLILAEMEALDLAGLRDLLLPELLSGRLRVRDAEKFVEESV
jgi:type I restriction enzyme S subunit